ncbi:60S ribosomal protein L13 [Phytophthora nicotianae]|nr:60S ribosomal protein L13 [Phytophthora nicotianae]
MVVKRVHNWDDDEPLDVDSLGPTTKKQKKLRVDREAINASKIVFDEEGNSAKIADRLSARSSAETEFADVEQHAKNYTEQVAARLAAKDEEDRRLEKERVRAKHHKKRMKIKGERDDDESEDEGARLAVASDDEDMSSGSESDSEEEASSEEEESDKKNVDRQAVASQEEMALAMLQRR